MTSNVPESVYWKGRGEALRIPSRRMDDHRVEYKTLDGISLFYVYSGWKAQRKGITTKVKKTAEEAMEEFDRINTCGQR